MKKLQRAAAITATLLGLFSVAPAMANDKMTLLLDWFINPDHGPIIIAQERGYFTEQGLDIEIVAPADPSDPPKLVAAGKADLAISYQPQLHLQIAEGLPLKRVGTLVATPLNCILTLKSGKIQSLFDLKGATFGFSVAGLEEAMLGTVLKKYDIKMDEVTLVNVNWSLSPSLLSGQVDAVMAYRNFELNQLKIEGVEGNCFYIEEEGVPAYDELIYVANPKTMDADKIKRFLAATEKATQYIVNHPNESWEIFAGSSKELNDELNKLAWFDTISRFALRPAAMSAGRYAAFEKFLFDAKLIKSIHKVSDIAIDLTAESTAK